MESRVLHDIIEHSVADPDHRAAVDLERELSYAQLIDEVARLGAGLSSRGVGEGDRVGLFVPNSVDFIVAALACLWVGAVFVPLAVTDPASRLATVIDNCDPALVVAPANVELDLHEAGNRPTVVTMDVLREEHRAPLFQNESSGHGAYMIYTSGTTGTPKGVQIGNRAFAVAVRSIASSMGLSSETITLCISPFHFDGSYANLFPTLISGGTVVIRPRDALLFPRTFFNTVAKERVNYSGFTPSYLRLLLASAQASALGNSSLQTIALGGEAVSVKDLRLLWSLAPSIRVVNRYGPTEATIAVTNVELTPDMIEGDIVSIGRPLPGVTFVLVGETGHVITTAGRTGELYIGGAQLMDGYWSDPVLTASVMRDDIVPGETLYRTGDLAYQDERGNYVCVGRADRVIKRSGVRISLVELSALMNQLDDVDAAVCLTFDRESELGIVAFVVTKGEHSALDLRRAASQLIPQNMLPDRFEFVESMPLNRSNQLDEPKLLSEADLRPFRANSSSAP
jgi:amino acid adenylation domain-containing protein